MFIVKFKKKLKEIQSPKIFFKIMVKMKPGLKKKPVT